MAKLTKKFLYANLGEKIVSQLASESSYNNEDIFSKDIIDKIQKNDGSDISDILDGFVHHVCPQYKDSPQKLNWVFNQYLTHRKNRRPLKATDLEDMGKKLRYYEAIRNSEFFKSSGLRSELLSYKDYDSFARTIDILLEVREQKKLAKKRKYYVDETLKAKVMSETTVIYEGDEGKVVVPHSKEASQYWGANTKWCLSGNNTADDEFPKYNQRSIILMMIPKNEPANKTVLESRKFSLSIDKFTDVLPESSQILFDKAAEALSASSRKNYLELIAPLKSSSENTSKTTETLSEEELVSEEKVISAIEEGRVSLYSLPSIYKRKRGVVLSSVKKNGAALFATPYFRDDREVVKEAVAENGAVLRAADRELQEDDDFVNELIYVSPDLAFNPSEDIRDLFPTDEFEKAQKKLFSDFIKNDDEEKIVKYARHVRAIWGDKEALFSGDAELIKNRFIANSQNNKPKTVNALKLGC